MTTSVNTAVNTAVIPTLREEFGTTKNRSKVSKISQDALNAFAKKENVKPGSFFTNTVVEKRKRNLGMGKVEKFVVYINYQEQPVKAEVSKEAVKA